MHILIRVVSSIYLFAGLIIAFLYVLRSGKYEKGILIGWGLTLIGGCVISTVLPEIASLHNHEYLNFFPEANGIPMIILFGWFEPVIVTIIAGLLRKIVVHLRPNFKWIRTNNLISTFSIFVYMGLFYFLLGSILIIILFISPSDRGTLPYQVGRRQTIDQNKAFINYILNPVPKSVKNIKVDEPRTMDGYTYTFRFNIDRTDVNRIIFSQPFEQVLDVKYNAIKNGYLSWKWDTGHDESLIVYNPRFDYKEPEWFELEQLENPQTYVFVKIGDKINSEALEYVEKVNGVQDTKIFIYNEKEGEAYFIIDRMRIFSKGKPQPEGGN